MKSANAKVLGNQREDFPIPLEKNKMGMTESEWKKATRFDRVDIGWIVMSIGMAIGAGIVFLPIQVGVMGLWVFLLSAVIGYPAMY